MDFSSKAKVLVVDVILSVAVAVVFFDVFKGVANFVVVGAIDVALVDIFSRSGIVMDSSSEANVVVVDDILS